MSIMALHTDSLPLADERKCYVFKSRTRRINVQQTLNDIL